MGVSTNYAPPLFGPSVPQGIYSAPDHCSFSHVFFFVYVADVFALLSQSPPVALSNIGRCTVVVKHCGKFIVFTLVELVCGRLSVGLDLFAIFK